MSFNEKIGSLAIFLLVVFDTILEIYTKNVLEKVDLLVMTKHATEKDCCFKS